MFLPLQISNDVLGYGELFIAGFSTIGLVLLGYLTLRRTPLLPSETQKQLKDQVENLRELGLNFANHLKDDEERFSDLWKISNEIKSESKLTAADIKVQIAELKLANAEGQTEIKDSLGKLVTSIAYIEAEIKRGIVETT